MDELKANLGIEASLIKGIGGVFEVTLENELIFSKKRLGRFPEPGEIVELINQKGS